MKKQKKEVRAFCRYCGARKYLKYLFSCSTSLGVVYWCLNNDSCVKRMAVLKK